jgi:lipoprotein-releasing system ATP-binding protein
VVQLQIAGRDMTGADDRLRTDLRRMEIGFVYQFHHLLPEFTAAENIMLPQQAAGKAAGPARKRALELLDQTGLAERADHRPSACLGGSSKGLPFAARWPMNQKFYWPTSRPGTLILKRRITFLMC